MPVPVGKLLGRYNITGQLGDGGMAIVYKAYDTSLAREVAIKVIKKGSFAPEQMERIMKRFEREAKTLAQLNHHNIINGFDYGDFEGAPYFVMEYVSGGTLRQRLSQQDGAPMPWVEACRLIIPIARALHYAHGRKFIHRDVKPSNILITPDGQPMLSDFGIVKIMDFQETHTLTGTGVGVGTPEYMAPEQWTGNVLPQSDQYSLALILYEMLTGRKPYQADTAAGIFLKQATEPVPPLRQFVQDLPIELEEIVLRALSTQPGERFPDMNAFANALESLPGVVNIEGKRRRKNVSASHPYPKKPSSRASRRSPAFLWILFGFLVLSGLGILGWEYYSSGGNLASISGAAGNLLSFMNTGTPTNTIQPPTATITTRPTATLQPSPTGRPTLTVAPTEVPLDLPLISGMQLPLQKKVIDPGNITELAQLATWGSGPVASVHWTEDGKYLVTASTHGITLYDAASLTPSRIITMNAYDSYFSSDGSYMAIPHGKTALEIQDVLEGTSLSTITIPAGTGDISAVAFSTNESNKLAIGTTKGYISIWNMTDGSELIPFRPIPTMVVSSLAFSPDDKQLASGSGSEESNYYRIRLWDVAKGTVENQILMHKMTVTDLAYSPTGLLLASTSADGYVYLHEVSTSNVNTRKTPYKVAASYFQKLGGRVQFSPEGQYFAYTFAGGIYLHQSSDGAQAGVMSHENSDYINSLAFSPDGRRLASASDDGSVRIWSVPGGSLIKTFGSNARTISALAFSKDGADLASGSVDGMVHLWQVSNGQDVRSFSLGSTPLALEFFSNSTNLVCGLENGDNLIIDTNNGNHSVFSNLTYKHASEFLKFSENGAQLVSAETNGVFRLWNVSSQQPLKQLDIGPADAFSVTSDFALVASNRFKYLYIWQIQDGKLLVDMKGQPQTVISLAFTRDNRYIFTGSSTRYIEITRVADGELLSTSSGSITTPSILLVSPSGSLLAAVGQTTFDLWNYSNNSLNAAPVTYSLPETGLSIQKAAFSPDGAYLVLGLNDGTIQVWGIP